MNAENLVKWLGCLCVCALVLGTAHRADAAPMLYALSDTDRHIEVYASNNGTLEHWGSFDPDFANEGEENYYALAAGHFFDGGHVDVAVLNVSNPCGVPPSPCALCGPEFDDIGFPFVRMPEVKIFRVEQAPGGGVTATLLGANNLSTTNSFGTDQGHFTYFKLFAGDFDGDGLDELGAANPLFGSDLAMGPNTPGVGPPAGRVEIMDFNDQPKSAMPLCFRSAPVSFSVLIDGFQMPSRAQFVGADVDGNGKDEIVSLVQTTGIDIDAFNGGVACGNQPCPGDGSPPEHITYPLGTGVLSICEVTDYGSDGSPTYRQGTCEPHPFSGQPISAGTGGVFPMALAAGQVGRGEVDAVFVGFNRGDNEATDPGTVAAFALDLATHTFLSAGTTTLGGPVGGLAAVDLDGNGLVELIGTRSPATGEQLAIFDFDGNQLDTFAAPEVAGGFRGNEFLAPTMPIIEPAAKIAGGAEKPLLRALFVPVCFAGDDSAFRSAVDAQVDFFLQSLDMQTCPTSLQVEVIPPSQFNFDCSTRPERVRDLRTGELLDPGLRQSFIDEPALDAYDINEYSIVVVTTDDPNYGGAVGGLALADDMVFIRIYPEGFLSPTGRRLNPEEVFAHEFGHLAGLAEEYCHDDLAVGPSSSACNSEKVINKFEARLQCPPPPSPDCCDPADGWCDGNINQHGDGPCIMSHFTARRDPGEEPPHAAYCENCLRHLKQMPPTSGQPLWRLPAAIDCGVTYPGDGPILSLIGSVSLPGVLRQIVSEFAPSGRPPVGGPRLAGEYEIRIEDLSTGATIYESFFDRTPLDVVEPPVDIEPVEFAPFHARIRLPDGVSPSDTLEVTTHRDGTFVSKTTLNGQAPTAVAGDDQTVECDAPGMGSFTLDGQASSDPDGDTLSYLWTGPMVVFEDPLSPAPIGAAPLGSTDVSLTVSDGVLESAPDVVTITVEDTLPPAISAEPEITIIACEHPLTTITIPLPEVTEVCKPGSVVLTGQIIESNGTPLVPATDLTNGETAASNLPAGVHRVRWEATDGGNPSVFEQLVRIEPCWPQFGREPSRSRQSPFVGPTTNARAFVFGGSSLDIESSPVVASDGTIYVGSDDNRLYAINVDGTQKWRSVNTGSDFQTSPAIGFGGYVFAANAGGRLYKLDPSTGAILCEANLQGSPTESSPVVGSDGTVYIGSDNDRLYSIDPANCMVKWTYETGADVDSSPAVARTAAGSDFVFFGSDDNKLYALDATGALQWTFTTGNDIDSSPAVSADGTTVYVGSDDEKVYALDAATGDELWSRDVDHDVETALAIGPTGTLYVGTQDGDAVALDAETGAILWTKELDSPIRASPAVDANDVVFFGADETVFALAGATGAILWSYKTGGDIRSSPAIGVNGTLYVGSDDDDVYAFGSPLTLGVRWTAADEPGGAQPGGAPETTCAVRSMPPRDGWRGGPWIIGLGLGSLLRRRRQRQTNGARAPR